ncbi:hypothetical protein PsorP6_001674 [Peronosclerospora sorghi]|uniref:Uncharacterized protein n=1 Tax=Peronosclerospora sorghi TaxID=230839 RepID=A0ACC0WSA2_9STRA|nr:hypothetical protein PsorP6_001674 [Peronosclerospora sorghi]
MGEQASRRKRAVDVIEIDDAEPSEAEKEEQLCAQATEAVNHFVRMYDMAASTEMARNRLQCALYVREQARRRYAALVLADTVLHDALQGIRVQSTWQAQARAIVSSSHMHGHAHDASELPVRPDARVKQVVKISLSHPTQTLVKRAVMLPKVLPLPRATMWTALTKNYDVQDEPSLHDVPDARDEDEADVVAEFYLVKKQQTSACEVEFIKQLCKKVIKSLQSSWNLTTSDLKLVAKAIEVEEKVLLEVHHTLRQSQLAAKKQRRLEAKRAEKKGSKKQGPKQPKLEPRTPVIAMTEYEQLADSFRSLFCRRCFVYDCDYHGCVKSPRLTIVEQNAVARSLKEKGTVMNRGRNCGNDCFLGQTSSTRGKDVSCATIDATRILWSRAYFICAGNFCEMAKILGNTSCAAVAEICAHYQIKDSCLPKAPALSKTRRSRRKTPRVSIRQIERTFVSQKGMISLSCRYAAMPRAQRIVATKRDRHQWLERHGSSILTRASSCCSDGNKGVGSSIPLHIEPCVHVGPCESGVCSCVDNGIWCAKTCHCLEDECTRRFRGCHCPRGQCRTPACPCFGAGRECDLDLCRACETRAPDGATSTTESAPSCLNRPLALGKRKHVRVGRSTRGDATWGLFVDEFVAKDEFLLEYRGEMVTHDEADRRGAVYDNGDRSYLFTLDTKTVIDATRKGNKARVGGHFMNHSSERPNCVCKIMLVQSDYRLGVYALQDLEPHTELFLDYDAHQHLYHAARRKQPTGTAGRTTSVTPAP